MGGEKYLRYIVENIHTVIVATVDGRGYPVTAAIDMMDTDGETLYFLTARGKSLYDRLKARPHMAFTAMEGEDTMSRKAISVQGRVRELGQVGLEKLFEKNPYMYSIYPQPEARQALTVFQIYEGKGEWFDLSKKPIERESFTFGGMEAEGWRYRIGEACIGCGRCREVCPQDCIRTDVLPFIIEQKHCLHCGNCLAVCPEKAVERR